MNTSVFWVPGEVSGAIPNGTRVIKLSSGGESDNVLPVGTEGTVLASHPPHIYSDRMGYYVHWDGYEEPVYVRDLFICALVKAA